MQRSTETTSAGREFSLGGQSAIRRYYIDTASIGRQSPIGTLSKDTEGLKLYVVARRSYLSYDEPYIAPPLLSRLPEGVILLTGAGDVANDIFDRNVVSTDGEEDVDEVLSNIRSKLQAVLHSPSANKVHSKDPTDIHHPTSEDAPPQEYDGHQHDTDQIPDLEYLLSSDLQLPSPVRSVAKLDRKTPQKSLHTSTSGLDRKTPQKQSAVDPVLKDVTKSAGRSVEASASSARERKSISKNANPPKRMTYRLASNMKNKALNLNNSVNGSELSHISAYNALFNIPKLSQRSIRADDTFTTPPIEHEEPEHVQDMDEDFGEGMDDYDTTGVDLDPHQDKTERTITIDKGNRLRQIISSAALLNSWYISHGSESNVAIDWITLDAYNERNARYPKRSRLPPTQHWSSNLVPDGSSILFLIGVSVNKEMIVQNASMASGDVVTLQQKLENDDANVSVPYDSIPDSSLVILNNQGKVEMQIVEETTDHDKSGRILPIEDKVKTINTPKRPIKKPKAMPNGTSKKADTHASDYGISAYEAIEILKNAPRVYNPESAEVLPLTDAKKTSNVKKKKVMKSRESGGSKNLRHELTADEALDILRNASQPILSIEDEKDGEKPRKRTRSIDSNLASNPDSSVDHDGKTISYRSVYRPEDVETIANDGINFKPMIMTSRCRTSNVLIPKNETLDFGNVKSNFICVYILSGKDLIIKGVDKEIRTKEKDFLFLPTYNDWSIKNNSEISEAKMVITFVNV